MHNIGFATLALAMLGIGPLAMAQQFPQASVKIIVAQPPGGSIDGTSRILATALSARWKQSVVVENKPGAGGTIGSELVAKAAPDGYTIMLSAVAQHTINQWLYTGLAFDPISSFAPVAMIGNTPMVLAVKPSLQVQNVAQFLALAKSSSKPLTYSSAGAGTYNHLAGASLAIAGKVELTHIPYKGVAPALADVIGGHVDPTIGTVPSVRSFIANGSLRALAVTTAKRSKALPDVPTLAESGLPGYDIAVRVAMFAPAGTPAHIVAQINAAIGDALRIPEIAASLERQGLELDFTSPAKLGEMIRSEAAVWGQTIKTLGIKLE